MSEKTGVGLQIANLAAVLIFPAFAVWYSHSYLGKFVHASGEGFFAVGNPSSCPG